MWDLHNNEHLTQVIFLLSISYLVYFFVFKFINFDRLNFKKVFLTAIFLHIFFLPIPYLTSNDLFSYIFEGRVFLVWGANPYLTPFDNFSFDPLYFKLRTVWSSQTVLYGPILIFISGFVNFLGQNNFLVLTYLMKFLFILANLISIYLIYKISKNIKALYLYAFNPLVIFELSGNSHTESFIVLTLLLSIYFLKKPIKSFVCLIISGLFKYYTFVFLPLYFVYLIKKNVKSIILAFSIGILVAVLSFLPFFNAGIYIFDYLLEFINAKFNYPSIGIFIGEKIFNSYIFSFQLNTLIFLLSLFVISIKFWFRKTELKVFIFYMWIIYFIFVLTKLSLVLSWYLTPLVALSSLLIVYKEYRKYALASIVFLSFYSLIIYYAVR